MSSQDDSNQDKPVVETTEKTKQEPVAPEVQPIVKPSARSSSTRSNSAGSSTTGSSSSGSSSTGSTSSAPAKRFSSSSGGKYGSSRPSRSSGRPQSNSNGRGSYRDSRSSGNNYRPQDDAEHDRPYYDDEDMVNVDSVSGYLDTSPDGHGLLREVYSPSRMDAYISTAQIRRHGLRPGDYVTGSARSPKDNDRYWGVHQVTTVNGLSVDELKRRPRFEEFVPVYPDKKFKLETGKEPISMRLIDLAAPIGNGQRGMIVSPPKAGKTTIMKEISSGIAANYSNVHLMAVLIGERPEEVTDIRRHIEQITKGKGEVAASNFDEPADEQTRIAELALERAKRLVELGGDVVILLDSITRLARAYNLAIPTSGRTLSGGFDPSALYPPKRFFGAARNFENGGSLTIIGTALVDTGSRMDDLIYEEFKGTGNMELVLDRSLAERRIFPAIDVQRSGTRKEDLLYGEDYDAVMTMRRMLDVLGKEERTQLLVDRLRRTDSNKEFLAGLKEG